MNMIIGLILLATTASQSEMVPLQILNDQQVPIVDLAVRVETPLGLLTARTNKDGVIQVPTSYPRLVVFIGGPDHLIRVPGVVEIPQDSKALQITLTAELLSQLKEGS